MTGLSSVHIKKKKSSRNLASLTKLIRVFSTFQKDIRLGVGVGGGGVHTVDKSMHNVFNFEILNLLSEIQF